MDRFIEQDFFKDLLILFNLKSNMDRFIVHKDKVRSYDYSYLKSNMDRFIGVKTTRQHADMQV